MTVVYFDASAFVKLLIEEDGSELAAELWDHADATASSRLTYPEVRAALAAARRDHRVDARQLHRLVREWEMYWSATRPVELTRAIMHDAGDLCATHGLPGADGIHLASARAFTTEAIDLVMAVWHVRLAAGAVASGIRVAPK